jgi:superfamily II DNA helicase RecQ
MTFVTLFDRGFDFRKDYSNLAMLCATFPTSPVVALTATASKADIVAIKESLNLRSPVEITVNPDRPNIFYKKIFRKGKDLELFEELLHNIATELKKNKLDYPLTIMYLQLKWCGFAFKYLSKHLGNEQYYPKNAEPIPENRLFA